MLVDILKNYASSVVSLNPKQPRLTLPATVLKSVGWNNLEEGESLIAEFVEAGHYRLHRKPDIEERILLAETRISEQAHSSHQKIALLQALADQFREVKFYRTDNNRVHLREEVTVVLLQGHEIDRPARLFIQSGENWVDVMTQGVRMARLQEFIS